MALNKKFSALTLTFASTLLLAACGGNDTDTTEASSEAVSSEVASSETATGLQDGTYTLVEKNFDLRPAAIIRDLELRRPIYRQTAAYGHFGRTDVDLPWEHTDKAETLRQQAGL